MERKHPLAACETCPYREGTAYVPSQFPKKPARLTVLGEAPGPQEAKLGVPFQGPSGVLLDTVLAHHGISRDECFVTNTTSCRPYGPTQKPPKEAIEACRERLESELDSVNTEYILAVGNTAAKVCLNDSRTITHLRVGPPKPYKRDKDVKVVATWHPAYCVSPETQILASNLTWFAAKSIVEGMELIGFDEYASEKPYSTRTLQPSLVTHVERVSLPCYRLITSEGEIISSSNHMWLAIRDRNYYHKLEWITTEEIAKNEQYKFRGGSRAPDYKIAMYCLPWSPNNSRESGYIAGFLDGEGYLTHSQLAWAQNDGVASDFMFKLASSFGYKISKSPVSGSPNTFRFHFGGKIDSLKALGTFRPVRLLRKADRLWIGKKAALRTVPVISSEFLGIREVIAITTTTRTFIANGFLSHNCLRTPDEFPSFVDDVGKLFKQHLINWQEPEYRVFDNPENAAVALRRLAENTTEAVIDIEVGVEKDFQYAHPEEYDLLCVGIAYARKKAIVIGENALKNDIVIKELDRYLDKVRIIGHNLRFDLRGLAPMIGIKKQYFDTLLASYCMVPETKVLKTDLTWSNLENLDVGDELVGFDDHFPEIMRPTYVKAISRLTAPCYEITVKDTTTYHGTVHGRTVTCSANHIWPVKLYNRSRTEWLTAQEIFDLKEEAELNILRRRAYDESLELLSLGKMKNDVAKLLSAKYNIPYNTIKSWMYSGAIPKTSTVKIDFMHLAEPWEVDRTYEGGYISGVLDGEGCLSKSDSKEHGTFNNFRLTFSQLPGPVADQTTKFLKEKGFELTTYPANNAITHNILGGREGALRAIGMFRPARLLAKSDSIWYGKRKHRRAEIESIKFVGDMEVIGLETTTSTFVANGFLTHNSLDERPRHHALKTLAVERLGAPKYDDEIKEFVPRGGSYANIPRPVLYKYNAYDVACTWELYELFLAELGDQRRIHDFMIKVSNELIHLELAGIEIDLVYNAKLQLEFTSIMNDLESQINEVVGYEINPRSVPQVTKYLVDVGKLIIKTTNEEFLKSIQPQLEGSKVGKFVGLLLKYRKVSKLYSTYVKKLPQKLHQGKIHTHYLLHGTTSGRLASRNDNLQNVSRDKRIKNQYVVESEENLLIQADYKQNEGRTICSLARDEYLRELFNDHSRDIFDEMCNDIFGSHNWDKEDRVKIKSTFYGQAYGRGISSISQELDISWDEANEIIRSFKALTPGMTAWQAAVTKQVLDGEDLVTPFGRRRSFHLITNENQHEVINEALSYLPQSIASDICLTALVVLRKVLDGLATMRLTVHDSLVAECHRNNVDRVSSLMKREMLEAAKKFTTYVDWAVDISTGKRYGDL